jgi:hypothetical protein
LIETASRTNHLGIHLDSPVVTGDRHDGTMARCGNKKAGWRKRMRMNTPCPRSLMFSTAINTLDEHKKSFCSQKHFGSKAGYKCDGSL